MKRLISLLTALALCFCLLPAAAGAAVQTVSTPEQLLSALQGGDGSYRLGADIQWPHDMTEIAQGKITLDLNGHTITGESSSYALFAVTGGQLTVTDRVGGGGIDSRSSNEKIFAAPIACQSGSLRIEGGSFRGLYALRQEGGSLTVTGGSFEGDRHAAYLRNGQSRIENGYFHVRSHDQNAAVLRITTLTDRTVDVTVTGGCFLGELGSYTNAIYIDGGSLTVTGGRFESRSFNALNQDGGSVSISGGLFSGLAAGCYTRNFDGETRLEISAGAFVGDDCGVYFNGADAAENFRLSGGCFIARYQNILGGLALQELEGQSFDQCLAEGCRLSSDESFIGYAGGGTVRCSAPFVKVVKESSTSAAPSRSYTPGMFPDADESQWYGDEQQQVLRQVYELGLMLGNADGSFGIDRSVTGGEVAAICARLHGSITGSAVVFDETRSPWYESYVDYCLKNGIFQADTFSSYDAPATRAQMAYAMARALPDIYYQSINQVELLPDVTETRTYGQEIFLLYRAGILTGVDEAGTFLPDNFLTRQEAAAILLRTADPSQRIACAPKLDEPVPPAPTVAWETIPAEALQQIDAIIAQTVTEGMSQWEIARVLHDYMVINYSYDSGVAAGKDAVYGELSFSYQGLLQNKVAVCQGYMELYYLLCNRAGLNCHMVVGYGINGDSYIPHGWNMLFIDGGRYYVDVTYDDPYLQGELVLYNYFLIDRQQLLKDHIIGLLQAKGETA